MPRFRFQRHLCTTLSALTFAFCVAVLPGVDAGAAGSEDQAVNVTMHAVLMTDVGFPVSVDVNLGAPAPATVHADGTITIPKDWVKFTTDALVAEPVPGTTISRVDVWAANDLTGWIDTVNGVMTLQGDVVAYLTGSGLENCPIGPTTLTLATNNPNGRAWDAATASATVSTPAEFAIPAIAPGAFGCAGQESWINAALGLGIPGMSSLHIDLQLTAPTPPPTTTAPPSATVPATPASVATTPPTTARATPARISTPARATASSASRSTATTATTAAPATTPTTTHVWPTESSHDLLVPGPDPAAGSSTTFGRAPIAAEFPVGDAESDRTSLGIGVILGSLGAGLAGLMLLRAEARKLFRRRERAAF